MDSLRSDPMFTADDDDEENDKRLAQTSEVGKVRDRGGDRHDRVVKKKVGGRNDGLSLQGNKLFGNISAYNGTGADEVMNNMKNDDHMGDENGNLICEDTDRHKKHMDWIEKDALEVKKIDDERKKSVEKYQRDRIEEENIRYMQGIQYQKDLVYKGNDNNNNNDDDDIEIEGESKIFFNRMKNIDHSNIALYGHRSLIDSMGLSKNMLKSNNHRDDIQIKDREGLIKVLRCTIVKKSTITDDEKLRLLVKTDLDDNDEGKVEKDNEDEDGDYNDDDEEYNEEVEKEIGEIKEMMLSDEEELGGNGILDEASIDDRSESNIERCMDEESMDDDKENNDMSIGKDHTFDSNIEAIEDNDESIVREEKKFSRLMKAKDIKENERQLKHKRRIERQMKYIEKQNEMKKNMRDMDVFENEADIGEVVDGRDGGILKIDVCVV